MKRCRLNKSLFSLQGWVCSVVKTLSCTVFSCSCLCLIKWLKLHEFWATQVFPFPKDRASQGLLYVISQKFYTQCAAFLFLVNGKSFTIKVCQFHDFWKSIFWRIFFIWPNCVLEAGCLDAWLLSQQHLALPQLLNHHHFSRRQRTYYTLEVLWGQLVKRNHASVFIKE